MSDSHNIAMITQKFERHYEESVVVNAKREKVFAYADDHRNFSSHMNKSSWMMGGGSMQTLIDEGAGQKVGSHIVMRGKVFGIKLFLDEVVTKHDFPESKEWQTVGELNLVIIDHYKLGFQTAEQEDKTMLNVYIDYNLPKSLIGRMAGHLLGDFYAKWCVKQMVGGVVDYFGNK